MVLCKTRAVLLKAGGNTMRKFVLFTLIALLVFVFMTACAATQPAAPSVEEMPIGGYIDVSPGDAKALIDSTSDIVIIDVSGVYDKGHLPNAINYYVGDWVVGSTAADLTTQGAGPGDTGYGVPDGLVTAADINYYVALWVAGCP